MYKIPPHVYPNRIRNAAANVSWAAQYVLTEYDHNAFHGESFEKPLECRIPEFLQAVGRFLFWADRLNEEAGMSINTAEQLLIGYETERNSIGKEV